MKFKIPEQVFTLGLDGYGRIRFELIGETPDVAAPAPIVEQVPVEPVQEVTPEVVPEVV